MLTDADIYNKKVECPKCDNKDLEAKHLQSHYEIDYWQLTCNNCGYSFKATTYP